MPFKSCQVNVSFINPKRKQLKKCRYVTGNVAVNIIAATAPFTISQNWIFNANWQKSTTWVQLIKLVVMWVGNIALSAFGVYLLRHYIHLHYLLSEPIVSPLPEVSYNYVVLKNLCLYNGTFNGVAVFYNLQKIIPYTTQYNCKALTLAFLYWKM